MNYILLLAIHEWIISRWNECGPLSRRPTCPLVDGFSPVTRTARPTTARLPGPSQVGGQTPSDSPPPAPSTRPADGPPPTSRKTPASQAKPQPFRPPFPATPSPPHSPVPDTPTSDPTRTAITIQTRHSSQIPLETLHPGHRSCVNRPRINISRRFLWLLFVMSPGT